MAHHTWEVGGAWLAPHGHRSGARGGETGRRGGGGGLTSVRSKPCDVSFGGWGVGRRGGLTRRTRTRQPGRPGRGEAHLG